MPVRTPNLDKLARRGVKFERAYAAAPVCAPSRACLAGGCDYDHCGVPGNNANYPANRPTYYSSLRDAGYHVAACGKLDLAKGEGKLGIDGRNHMAEWGFSDMINCGGKGDAVVWWEAAHAPTEPYMAYLEKVGFADAHAADIRGRGVWSATRPVEYSHTYPTPLPDAHYEDNWIGRTAVEVMNRMPKGQPWHLAVNFAGPHDPLDITKSMASGVQGRAFPQPTDNDQLAPDVHNKIRQNYTAMIENIDRWVGVLVDELAKRGELDNTIIVFSSDHGEMLGDHNRWAKNFPYEASTCVPLIVAGPGIAAGNSDALVSVIDIGATFLDYAGADGLAGMTARSLRPLLAGDTREHRQHVNSGLFNWRMVFDGHYKLIRGFDPDRQYEIKDLHKIKTDRVVLFDLKSDPHESRNIADQYPKVVERLLALLPGAFGDPGK